MAENNDKAELVKAGASKPVFKMKAVGLAAKKQAVAATAKAAGTIVEFEGKPEEATHRIGIVFDDSGSMSGKKIEDAHAGTEEFIRCCDPRNTAISVYPMNSNYHTAIALTTKLYNVAQGIKTFQATGGTPLFEAAKDMLQNEKITRGIIFSDGEPNSEYKKEEVIGDAIEKKIPIDTVFIGDASREYAVALMKEIAERTGGVFIILDPSKSNFRTAFKYLSPGYRAMLADKSFVEKLQEGKVS